MPLWEMLVVVVVRPHVGGRLLRGGYVVWGLVLRWLGITRASDPLWSFAIFSLRAAVFSCDMISAMERFAAYAARQNKTNRPTVFFVSDIQSRSCEWLKHRSLKGGTTPIAAFVVVVVRDSSSRRGEPGPRCELGPKPEPMIYFPSLWRNPSPCP